MKIYAFKNKEEILEYIKGEGKNYIQIPHKFSAGEIIEEHFHPQVDEWLIFNSGRFEVAVDFEKKIIEGSKGFSFIHFPKGYVHGLKCLTDISYTVLRDGKDAIKYLDSVMKLKDSIKPIPDAYGQGVRELYHKENLRIAYITIGNAAKKQTIDVTYRVEKGEGQIVVNDKTRQIKKGDVLPVSKHNIHYFKNKKGLEVLAISHPENILLEHR